MFVMRCFHLLCGIVFRGLLLIKSASNDFTKLLKTLRIHQNIHVLTTKLLWLLTFFGCVLRLYMKHVLLARKISKITNKKKAKNKTKRKKPRERQRHKKIYTHKSWVGFLSIYFHMFNLFITSVVYLLWYFELKSMNASLWRLNVSFPINRYRNISRSEMSTFYNNNNTLN